MRNPKALPILRLVPTFSAAGLMTRSDTVSAASCTVSNVDWAVLRSLLIIANTTKKPIKMAVSSMSNTTSVTNPTIVAMSLTVSPSNKVPVS